MQGMTKVILFQSVNASPLVQMNTRLTITVNARKINFLEIFVHVHYYRFGKKKPDGHQYAFFRSKCLILMTLNGNT